MPRKRDSIQQVSCNRCRTKKRRCDGARPECSACSTIKAVCEYVAEEGETRAGARLREKRTLWDENTALLRERDDLMRELEGLRSGRNGNSNGKRPRRESSDGRRSSNSTDLILATAATSPRDGSFPLDAAARVSLPYTLSVLEYELMLSQPNAYAIQGMPDFETLRALHGRRIREVFGGLELATESQSTSSTRPLQMNGLEDADWLDKVDGPISRAALLPPSQPLVQSKPFCDRRLERLDLSLWSEVEASNHFVASVISFYLVGELPMWGLFDADLFLDGLIGLPSPTCSPLLVNALLFWACHGYSAVDEQARRLRKEFFAEAMRHWEIEKHIDSLPTIVASVFLQMGINADGEISFADSALQLSHAMAHRLGLYGPADETSSPQVRTLEQIKVLRARAHTAWGYFCYITMHAFLHNGMIVMRQPPKYVIPGEDIAIAYTGTPQQPVFHHLPRYMGNTFTRLCSMYLIVNEIVLYHFTQDTVVRDTVTVAFTERVYRKLLDWAAEKGALIEHWDRDEPHQSMLHILYHNSILDVFRPLLGTHTQLLTFPTRPYTPEEVFLASVHQIRRQHLLFPLVHPGAATTCVFWYLLLMHSCNVALTMPADNESRQFFLMSVLHAHELARCFPIMASVVSGFLTMGVYSGALAAGEARELRGRLTGGGAGEGEGKTVQGEVEEKRLEGKFALDLNNASLQRPNEASSVGSLAHAFDDLAL